MRNSKNLKALKVKLAAATVSAAKKMAAIGCSSASVFGLHQPKEPVNISERLKKN